jgi:hypothetical protein
VQAFAAELRRVREAAGNPKYLQMARATGRSRTALSEAAGGDHLASWETVEAYLAACGQDPAAWRSRWEAVRAQVRPERPPAGEPQPSAPPAQRSRTRLVALAVIAAVAAITAVLAVAEAGTSRHSGRAEAHPAGAPPGSALIVVQNKVAIGPSSLTEDVTPSYLSAKPEPACAQNGCEAPGTWMWSGAVLHAICQLEGTTMTNEDLASPGIQHNPGRVTSALWYRAQTRAGRTGYISEVYLTPASRGGLHLPDCTSR